ncbi:hypothetical protein [Soonwooa sp.]|uniref:hypothetical protein n=1 Tax=Soonwooa sp. TaxID=1938592 RepID=UPI0028A8F6CC|nr:hypothetical protein [Soonwooa sp.]
MKKFYFLILIFFSVILFSQQSKVDSIYARVKPNLKEYIKIDPSIQDLENRRLRINENLGLIILEDDPIKRKELINKNIAKDKRANISKLRNKDIEELRSTLEKNIIVQIELKCLKIEQQYLEFEIEDMKKSKVKFLTERGYNLHDFNSLTEQEQKIILKDWKYKK